MKKLITIIFSLSFLLISVFQVRIAFAENHDKFIYSSDAFDKYRSIKYWARVSISIVDYKYNSGDAEFLKLSFTDPYNKSSKFPAIPILNHFNNEFIRLIKGGLPIIDTDKGREERIKSFLQKKKDFDFDEYTAYEEARRESIFGKNPGAIYCIIRISRREFPVLYEISTNIIANKDLSNYGSLLSEKDIGFSTPEHIEGELKRVITEHLEKLSVEMNKIKKYGKR
jgi:hypothetical protein